MTRPPRGRGWTPVSGDLLDAGAIDEIVASLRPDLVVHLAGQASIGRALDAAEQTWRANFFGASIWRARSPVTLRRLWRCSPPAFRSTARALMMAWRPKTRRCGRSTLMGDRNRGRRTLADVLGARSRLVIARPVNHSGPRQSEKSFVLSSFAAQIAAIEAGRKQPELQVGDLSKARDFLDVRDVVAAYRALIAKAPELPDRVNVFNIASGQPHPIGDLLDRLRRARQDRSKRTSTRRCCAPRRSISPPSPATRPTARNHRLAPAAYDRRYAAIAARILARSRERPRMTDKGPERDEAKDERIRLLDYQLDYLRAELSQLVASATKSSIRPPGMCSSLCAGSRRGWSTP